MDGEERLCPIVAFVDRAAFGEECADPEVVKSFVPGDRFCEDDHPSGNAGGATASKFCV